MVDESGATYYFNGETQESAWERPPGPESEPGHFVKAQLVSEDTFILDCGSEVYVWVGRGSNAPEKKQAMINAQVCVCAP